MSKKYTCSVCSRDCKTDCIYCETCQACVHYKCQGVDEPDCKIWRRIPLDYVCVSCRSACNRSSFDCHMGLDRLKKSAREGLKSLTIAAERDISFIKNTDLDTTVHTNFESIRQDPCSNNIMAAYHLSSNTALYSTGDGDCLFNSFSTYLVGNESKSIELRYRCSIEFVLNKDKIQKHPIRTEEQVMQSYKMLTSIVYSIL